MLTTSSGFVICEDGQVHRRLLSAPRRAPVHTRPLSNRQVPLHASKPKCVFAQPVVRASKLPSPTGDPKGQKKKTVPIPVLLFLLLWGNLHMNPVGGKERHLPLSPRTPQPAQLGASLCAHLLCCSEAGGRARAAQEVVREDNHRGSWAG